MPFYIYNTSGFPVKYDKENSGIDLALPDDVTIGPFECKLVPLNVEVIYMKEEVRRAFQLTGRSSLSKTKIQFTSYGIIDRGYDDILKAMLFNPTPNPITLEHGRYILQIVTPGLDHDLCVEELTSINEFDNIRKQADTSRGRHGFGSTDK